MPRGTHLDPAIESGFADPASMPSGEPLPGAFFDRPAAAVARDLVGTIIWRPGVGGGRLVEVEAYLPEGDEACHASRGRTARNTPMYGAPGEIYVYLIYGMHHLLNIVTGSPGVPSAILLRAFRPIEPDGMPRETADVRASGPGLLTRALGVDRSWNGAALGPASGLMILDDGCRPLVQATPRIGISRSRELELRFVWPESRFLSKPPRTGRPVRRACCAEEHSQRPGRGDEAQ